VANKYLPLGKIMKSEKRGNSVLVTGTPQKPSAFSFEKVEGLSITSRKHFSLSILSLDVVDEQRS
jgi:hypothetical protein